MAKGMTRTEKALFATPVCALLLSWGISGGRFSRWWTTHNPFADPMQTAAYQLAGEDAEDCGWVTVSEGIVNTEHWDAHNCEVDDFQRGKPFRVRYDSYLDKTPSSLTIVQTPHKQVYELSQRSEGPLQQKVLKHPRLTRESNGLKRIIGDN